MSNRTAVFTFKETSRQLTKLLEPIAWSIKCLESALTTPADVYLFLLATLASYEDIFLRNDDIDGLSLPENVMRDVHKIINARWREVTHGDNKVVYLATFFLDLCMPFSSGAQVLQISWHVCIGFIGSLILKCKNTNPLSATVPLHSVATTPPHQESVQVGKVRLMRSQPELVCQPVWPIFMRCP